MPWQKLNSPECQTPSPLCISCSMRSCPAKVLNMPPVKSSCLKARNLQTANSPKELLCTSKGALTWSARSRHPGQTLHISNRVGRLLVQFAGGKEMAQWLAKANLPTGLYLWTRLQGPVKCAMLARRVMVIAAQSRCSGSITEPPSL